MCGACSLTVQSLFFFPLRVSRSNQTSCKPSPQPRRDYIIDKAATLFALLVFLCVITCDCEFEAMTTGDIQRMYFISWIATCHSSVSFIPNIPRPLPIMNETTAQQGLSDSGTPNSTSPKLMLLLKAHLSNKSYATSQVIQWSTWGAEAQIIWAYLRSVHDPANNRR